MPGARKKPRGGAPSSPSGSVSRPARRPRRPEEQVPQKTRERRSQESGRLASPAGSSPPLGPLLLFFPTAGDHRTIFKGGPGAICQISCKQAYLAVAQTPKTVQLFGRAQDKPHQPLVESRGRIYLKEKINSFDCEASHLLILSTNGKLSEHDTTTKTSQIRLLKELANKQIVQIACGDHHSMALSKGGELFAWGENEHGQLGVGKAMGHIKEPQLVQALEGIPLINIAAGSAHSMVVSIFGTVYSWGKNMFGQLGLGDTEDRYIPTNVKALEQKKTVFISCGGEHTAVLSKDGLVCTFGSGCYGQLGHNSTCNELFPRLVAELFGAQVTQVACGRWHTLVYVPALGEVYSFGYGAEGQHGEGRTSDQLIPLPLDLGVRNKHRSTLDKVVKIIAGGNQSIVLHLEEKNAYTNVLQTLATVEEEKVLKWLSNSDPSCWNNIKWNINLIFSSAACINGSFLQQREEKFRTFEETVGVDMSAVLLFFKKIATKPKVFTQVKRGLKSLLGCPLHSPTSPEALRFFLIVPALLQNQDVDLDPLLNQLAEAIWKLPQKGKQALETLWSNLEVCFFKDLVSMFQRLIGVNMLSYCREYNNWYFNKSGCTIPLKVFQMLYEVNCRSGFKIQESNFYVPEAKKIISKWDKLLNWFHVLNHKSSLLFQLFIQFPWILNLENKIVVHKTKCTMLHWEYKQEYIVTSTMNVRKQYLLQDTWHYLRNAEEICFQQYFQVYFQGEPGVKYGGLIQEFFTIISRQLCNLEEQVFRRFDDSGYIWFLREISTQEDIYFLIGNLFGIALQNQKIIALPFPLALFKKLANMEPTLEDLKEVSPTVGRNLQYILDQPCDDIFKSMELSFTITEKYKGSIIEVDLKENGVNIPVTLNNRKEYVDAYVNYMFNDSVKKQFEDFTRGFQRGCPSTTWKMFLPVELRSILFGHTTYDWDQLEKIVRYRGFEKSDETIKNFWTVFHELPEENKRDFLAFLTGTVRIPGEGMDNYIITIVDPDEENPDQAFPKIYTCTKSLHLPRYTDKHILKERLLFAIENFRDNGLA
ncbi:E3 ISG15--protein ligase HERC5-like [Notechis scutatus]|uniref:E3 ISG15--protein ligase HERC5-like n=1 Tax=Notechis scutatus TaxID=8663 RepID=A0A6J1UBN5_9SAUR|nr:E3 ISG15--protein ligase HERC5-like [Notechis scutatus]